MRVTKFCPCVAFLICGFLTFTVSAREESGPKKEPVAKSSAEESVKKAETGVTEPQCFAVVGATVFPVSRPMIRRGTVIWKQGKIVEVGSEIAVPEGAEVIPGDDLYVTPGFVAIAAAAVGIRRAQGDIRHSLDPYDLGLRVALAHGITTVQLLSSGGGHRFSQDFSVAQGTASAVIKLTYGDLASMFLRGPGLNYLSLPGRQVELNLYLLRERFRKAADHLKKAKQAEVENAEPPEVPKDVAYHVTVLRNERPTVVSPLDNQQVRVALELQEEYGFDLVLNEPNDAWTMASELASRNVPVLIKARERDFRFGFDRPVLEEGDMIAIRRPHAFAERGVLVAILPYRRTISLRGLAGRDLGALAFDAAFAVRGGMSEDDALKAITLNPARILGVEDRLGSLEEGKDADFLILSGHPLDFRTFVLKAYINGKVYYDREESRLFRQVPLPEKKF